MSSGALRSGLRLRAILIPIYIPTFILCICTAVIVNEILPTLGLIPCTISFVHCSLVTLSTWRKRTQHEDEDDDEGMTFRRWPMKKRVSVLSSPYIAGLVDLFIACTLLSVLVCTWTVAPWETGYHWGASGRVILATYTTVPMIFEFIAHSWLAILDLREIIRSMRHYRNTPAECPNCHARLHNSDNRIDMAQGDRAEDYTINRPSEERTFRDASFDSDVAIQPDAQETGTTGSKDS